jgi:putative tryptophan/tyrosine transport system substrate-binding protein
VTTRRKLITLLGSAATWPLAALAQQTAMPVIGVLGIDVNDARSAGFLAFRQSLTEAGYADGRNVVIEYRWSEGHIERYPELAADLVRRQVAVIVALRGLPAAIAAKAATTTIPVVFIGAFDPVESGLVRSLNRPGGNLTGAVSLGLELGPKRLEMMHELTPPSRRFALLINPDHPNAAAQSRDMQTAAHKLGLEIRIVRASVVEEFDAAFAGVARLEVSGLVIGIGQPFNGHERPLGELAARHAVPAIFFSREFVAAGGLMSYGGSEVDLFRLAGAYTGRILKGQKPDDLPVQQSTKVELIINLKTARALGITVPLPLLGRADEVIE